MIVRFTDTCAVGLPPDIEQAWALLGLYKHATPIALAGRVLGLALHYTGRTGLTTNSGERK